MRLLAIETATHETGAAIGTSEGPVACFSLRRERRHVESLVPAVSFLCSQYAIDPTDFDAVVVDQGPGLFTGLRVGIATANAIAYAADVPVVGISSLDALAFPARLSRRRIIPVLDARRDEVYFGQYRSTSGELERLSEPCISRPEDLLEKLAPAAEGYLIVGDGGRRYARCFLHRDDIEIADRDFDFPRASSLIELAGRRLAKSGTVGQLSSVEPTYLRLPDAKLPDEAAGNSSS